MVVYKPRTEGEGPQRRYALGITIFTPAHLYGDPPRSTSRSLRKDLTHLYGFSRATSDESFYRPFPVRSIIFSGTFQPVAPSVWWKRGRGGGGTNRGALDQR